MSEPVTAFFKDTRLLATVFPLRNDLVSAKHQLPILSAGQDSPRPSFEAICASHGPGDITAHGIETLQINVGKRCNQTCRHCHVDAGPNRRESMSRETIEACLDVVRRCRIPLVDITGGAPEMHPEFRNVVCTTSELSCRVIDRCNLTILVAPGFDTLPEFLAEHHVEIVASLPCYLEENVDRQRGDRVFLRSLEALRRLNALGYGRPNSSLSLTLVYNPTGPTLPPDQCRLEADYRQQLWDRYGIEFTRLYTITNMPISRFLDDLVQTGRYDEYMNRLISAFNPSTMARLMCRSLLSVDWRGYLYDCDFNQMLELPLTPAMPRHISELSDEQLSRLARRRIMTGQHCFGCTAGAGSSCQGSLQT